MPEWSEKLQAQKSASTVLVLFVPSVVRQKYVTFSALIPSSANPLLFPPSS